MGADRRRRIPPATRAGPLPPIVLLADRDGVGGWGAAALASREGGRQRFRWLRVVDSGSHFAPAAPPRRGLGGPAPRLPRQRSSAQAARVCLSRGGGTPRCGAAGRRPTRITSRPRRAKSQPGTGPPPRAPPPPPTPTAPPGRRCPRPSRPCGPPPTRQPGWRLPCPGGRC